MTASLPHDQTLSFQRVSKQNPRRFPAEGSCRVVRPSSEVALSAEQHGDAALVLQLIRRCRLGNGSRRGEKDITRELLVQLRPVDVEGEGEVLHRGPDDVATDHCDVEVGVAVAGQVKQRHRVEADRCLGKTAVLQRAIGTVDGARPVGIPVVGEATAEAPTLYRFKIAAVDEYGIIDGGEPEALVRDTAATKHRDGGREQALEVIAACTVRIDALQVEGVARASRNVFDRQGGLNCPAPLIRRVTESLVSTVVTRMVVMRHCGQLEQTPGLVNGKRTDDVRSNHAGADARRPVTCEEVYGAGCYARRHPARK